MITDMTAEELRAIAQRLDAWSSPDLKGQLMARRCREVAALLERASADLDPPICRLQFPDGTVPGNVREAAEGWKRWADQYRWMVEDARAALAVRQDHV